MTRPDIEAAIETGLADMRDAMGIEQPAPAPSVINFPVIKRVYPVGSLQSRFTDSIMAIEDIATFMEALARQCERGNIEREQIIKHLRLGAESARTAARTLEGA